MDPYGSESNKEKVEILEMYYCKMHLFLHATEVS